MFYPWLSTIVLANPIRPSGIQAVTGPKVSENAYSGTNTTVYSRTDPEIALPLTNVGKIVLYNFVGVGVPIAYYRKVTNGEDVARPACCKLRCLAILRRKGIGSNPETSLQLKSNPTLLQ